MKQFFLRIEQPDPGKLREELFIAINNPAHRYNVELAGELLVVTWLSPLSFLERLGLQVVFQTQGYQIVEEKEVFIT